MYDHGQSYVGEQEFINPYFSTQFDQIDYYNMGSTISRSAPHDEFYLNQLKDIQRGARQETAAPAGGASAPISSMATPAIYTHNIRCPCPECLNDKQKKLSKEQRHIKALIAELNKKNDFINMVLIFFVFIIAMQMYVSKPAIILAQKSDVAPGAAP